AVQEGNIGAGYRPVPYRGHPFHRDLGDQANGDGMVLVDIITKCPGEVNPGDLLPSYPGLVHQGLAGSEDGCLAHDQGFDIILRDDDILSYRSLVLPGNGEFGYLAALPDPFMGDG